jgi:hypothetical protein
MADSLVPSTFFVSSRQLTKATEDKLDRDTYENYLNIDLDEYNSISFSQEEINKIVKHFAKLKTGSTSMVPLICVGNQCPTKDECIFWKLGKPPVGKQCLVELSLLNSLILEYMDEYKVEPSSITERGFCQELAIIDIYLYRVNLQLAKPQNALMVTSQAVGIDKDGEAIFREEISPLAEYRDKLFNRKARIIKLMVGDPQEKYKKQAALKQKLDNDQSNNQADTSKKIKDLQRQLDQLYGNTAPIGSNRLSNGTLLPQDIIDSDD